MDSSDTVAVDGDDELVEDGDLFPGCSNMDEFLQAGYPVIMEGIRASNALPQDRQFGYLKTFPEFSEVMKAEGNHLQEIMQKIITYCGVKKQIAQQQPSEKFDVVTDLNDKLLDRVVKNLSEIDGTRFNPYDDFGESSKKVSGSWNKNNLLAAAAAKELEGEEIAQLVVKTRTIRPQVLFKDKIDNRNVAWVPKIEEKPNQLKPLALIVDVNDQDEEYYRHPYEYELSLWKPQETWLVPHDVIEMPQGVENTPYLYVETEEDLEDLLVELKKQTMFAVDLEAHSYRSYMGFVCLMQISTEAKDYVIDTLKLRHKMYILNEVFTNPKIIKIFHGASNDIEWLQRDFYLYVVGMFDTFCAAKVLNYPKLSLAYLLKSFCGIDADKKLQLYDWRIRPLPQKAIRYAREDTHYLMYIYKKMVNELIEKGLHKTKLLEVAFMNSCQTCQKVFMKPRWNQNSHMPFYIRMKRHFDNRQLYALKEIYKWRDTVAREEDESTGYVLPNHMMMQICQTLPRELQGILACCNPIPPLVRQHALQLHQIILKAKEQPLVKSVTEMENIPSKSSQFSVSRDVDLEIRLNTYVHDTVHIEFRDDMPTLLDGTLPELKDPPVVKPKLSLLLKPETLTNNDLDELAEGVVNINFVSPYERYKKILPYSIQQEKEQIEKAKKMEEDRMEKSTEKQYATVVTEPSSSPRKRRAEEEQNRRNKGATPLIDQAGAVKKIKTMDISIPEDEVDNILPLIKAEKKVKQERDEEELANRVGSCGGSISSAKKNPPRQRLSSGPRDDNFMSPRTNHIPSGGQHIPSRGRSPSRGQHTPSRGRHSPSRGQHTPSRGRHSPSRGQHAPSRGRHSPSRGQQTPSRGRRSPSRGQHTPSRGRHSPSTGRHSPTRGQHTPSRGRHSPSRGQHTPSRGRGGQGNPAALTEDFTPFDYGSVNFDKFQSRISLSSGDGKRGGKKKNRQFRGKQSNKGKRGGQRGRGAW